MSNVKLAIRVRPFTERELKSEKDRVSVVDVIDDHTVTITNVKVSASGAGDSRERVRRYNADYTFDSACQSTEPSYASQEKVFETIGREVVASVTRGSSACVLAYGQSATGKTHTMMGTDAEPGLVPRLCRELALGHPLDITISFLEIYNERVHDLLAGETPSPLACHSLPRRRGNARKDLRVREHPLRGPYVQNLRRVAVTDVATLLSLVEEGARRRRTAATRRNATSSRSHALLELATSRATLHLADLAGSEKASWEGCGGGRQKEGANINKSLVALSNVISALVSGGARGKFVPYRDSALTWLLKDCFTGGASTFIIATVSPSVACYGESASTLRWAERARHLRTPRTSMIGPITASRAALQAQLSQLLAELNRYHIRYISGKIFFEDEHWILHENNKDAETVQIVKTDAKIGNLMDMFKPKAEAHNSESTASSAASGSSETINTSTMDKNIDLKAEVTKEVDKLFGPALERTRSGSDLGAIVPLRHKRKQYKSQEMLPIDKPLQIYTDIAKKSPNESQEGLNVSESTSSKKIPILYDNQRAEIVASVTERLYSKLRKKEEAAVSKMESMVDRKIVEPLSELRICTNARQRLMELSQKSMRNKRRIGIPAHTQTRLIVTRVREQGTDVQTDLESYIFKKDKSVTLQRDVGTETVPITPRCKEVGVGSKAGSLNYRDTATATDHKPIIRDSFTNTDTVLKYDRCSQTQVVPPPRRKRRASIFSKYIENDAVTSENYAPSVISINISQQYPMDSESQSSDDNMNCGINETQNKSIVNVTATPDLLTNHNTIDSSIHQGAELGKVSDADEKEISPITLEANLPIFQLSRQDTDDFPETEECCLPRIKIDPSRTVTSEEIKNMILGRNVNMYPYNIVLSPPKERENTKKIVKFQETVVAPVLSETTKSCQSEIINCKANSSSDITTSEKDCCNNSNASQGSSDFTDSSRADDDCFVWKSFKRAQHYRPVGKGNTSVCKGPRYRAAKTKIYREFLGLETKQPEETKPSVLINTKDLTSSDSTENERARLNFMQRRQFFEDKFNRGEENGSSDTFSYMEKGILNSCYSLDTAVSKYENYLSGYNNRFNQNAGNFRRGSASRTPREYLHYLVNLRKELVKDYDVSDSSVGLSRK